MEAETYPRRKSCSKPEFCRCQPLLFQRCNIHLSCKSDNVLSSFQAPGQYDPIATKSLPHPNSKKENESEILIVWHTSLTRISRFLNSELTFLAPTISSNGTSHSCTKGKKMKGLKTNFRKALQKAQWLEENLS